MKEIMFCFVLDLEGSTCLYLIFIWP